MPPFAHPLYPLWKSQPKRWDYSTATHLLNRAGFGGNSQDIQTLVALGPQKAVESLLNFSATKDLLPALEFGELSGPIIPRGGGGGAKKLQDLRDRGEMLRELSPEQKRALVNLRQVASRGKLEEMKLWWLDRMVRTPRPLEEKMTLFWHGLFVSSAVSIKESHLLYQQNLLLRKHALGNFKTLTLEISQDPAMLEYLNNNQNKKARSNENYARELMELFTLGIGNYTEQDIKESARAFTGWTNAGNRFLFNPQEHDDGVKNFLGHRGNFDGADIINIIFDQPAAVSFQRPEAYQWFAGNKNVDKRMKKAFSDLNDLDSPKDESRSTGNPTLDFLERTALDAQLSSDEIRAVTTKYRPGVTYPANSFGMTFSEFGRRVSENASKGTDHGTGAPLFVFGTPVKAGIYGAHPSLAASNLDKGDLKFHTDFRCVYASILEKWLKADAGKILGTGFKTLPFLA